MQWRNSEGRYGLVAVVFHWLIAVAVFVLFGLGLYMVGLDYYDPWYHRLPAIHKSIGILLSAAVLLRLLWRLINPHPRILGSALEARIAPLVHGALYILLFAMLLTGYLIASDDGRPIPVFDWFDLPAWVLPFEDQAEWAGELHELFAWSLIALAVLHAAAALKHHFYNRDATLLRMLGRG